MVTSISAYGGGASYVVSCFPGLSVLLCLALWYSMMIVAIAHTTSRHTTSTTTTTGTITAVIVELTVVMVAVGVVTILECCSVSVVIVTGLLAA